MNILLKNSSQPYLFTNQNNVNMLYCNADQSVSLGFGGSEYTIRPWKIKIFRDENNISVLNTPKSHPDYGSVILECNPHIEVKNNYIKIYYTAGFAKDYTSPISYYMCSLIADNTNFDNLRNFEVIQRTFTGTMIDNKIIFVDKVYGKDTVFIKNIETHDTNSILQNIDLIETLRISNVFNSDKLIITGKNSLRTFVSYLINKDFSIDRIIKNTQGYDVYKCSLLNNILAYTIHDFNHSSEDVENRSIVIENL